MTARVPHRPVPRRSRLDLAIWGASLIAGSTIGGTLALRAEPAAATPPPNAATAPPPPDTVAVATAPPPSTAAAAPLPNTVAVGTVAPQPLDPHTAAIASIKDALTRFLTWSQSHPGARCPDAATLGAPSDPWGHPLRVTCTDQPADQLAGIISTGPDGAAGTRDDLVSWSLGADVTDLVRGPRWRSRRGAPHLPAPSSKPPASTGAGSSDSDNDGDGIPDRR